jgi:hypothetical protein
MTDETLQLILKGRELAFDSEKRTQNMVRLSENIVETGEDTIVVLRKQHAQLQNAQDDLDTIRENKIRINREMDTVESFYGQLKNLIGPKSVKAKNTNLQVDKKVKTDRKKEERKIRSSEKHTSSPESERVNNTLPKELEILGSDAVESIVNTDNNLDTVSRNLKHAKSLAQEMGIEILTQNRILDSVNKSAHDADMDIREGAYRCDRLRH